MKCSKLITTLLIITAIAFGSGCSSVGQLTLHEKVTIAAQAVCDGAAIANPILVTVRELDPKLEGNETVDKAVVATAIVSRECGSIELNNLTPNK